MFCAPKYYIAECFVERVMLMSCHHHVKNLPSCFLPLLHFSFRFRAALYIVYPCDNPKINKYKVLVAVSSCKYFGVSSRKAESFLTQKASLSDRKLYSVYTLCLYTEPQQ